MTAGNAYIDESYGNDYLVVCSTVASGDIAIVRKQIRALLLPKQRSLHMKDETKPARRDLIFQTFSGLTVQTTIYCAALSRSRRHMEARDDCLQRAASDAAKLGVVRLVLDRNDRGEGRDKRSIILGAGSSGSVPFSYEHLPRHQEMLLALPDAFGWFYAKGGSWRTKVSEFVDVIDV